jgi:hypothetical protein
MGVLLFNEDPGGLVKVGFRDGFGILPRHLIMRML